MRIDILLGVLIWLLIMSVGPVVVYFKVQKPFSTLQKVGVLLCVLALVAVLVFPIISMGILSLNFYDTLNWIGQRSNHDLEQLCEYYVPVFLTWFVFAPIISAMLYMSNVAKKVGGLLLIVPPLYLMLLSITSSFLEFAGQKAGLASGSIVYLLCGIALTASPFFVKSEMKPSQGKRRFIAFIITLIALVGLAPAILIQADVAARKQDKTKTMVEMEDEVTSTEMIEIDTPVTETSADDNKSGDIMESVSADDCFVKGIDHIARYNAHWQNGNYSKTVIPQIYQYKNQDRYDIRAGIYKGSFDFLLSGDHIECSLNPGDLLDVIDIDGSTEFFFGQSDINGDGVDELIIAGRTIQEGGNRICVNVYNMNGEGFTVSSFHNKTAYANTGIAFIEPYHGKRNGSITICEEEKMDYSETWYLQDDFEWIKE